ncbi:MAG: hypothetical protein LBV68_05920 [Spirochaetaceae bacterium]|jgi:hypothetical protein|nr:hypothetical protein [Spirochaetaceae bacterium]
MERSKKPSIFTDRSDIGSDLELDEYGVWVKNDPEDIFTDENKDESDFDELLEDTISTPSFAEETGINGEFSSIIEESNAEFDTLFAENPDYSDEAHAAEADVEEAESAPLTEIGSDETSRHIDFDDIIFDIGDPLVDVTPAKNEETEPVEQESPPESAAGDSAAKQKEVNSEGLTTIPPELFFKISDELSALKTELSTLKNEISTIRENSQKTSVEESVGDKSEPALGEQAEELLPLEDKNEEEKVALTDDELYRAIERAGLSMDELDKAIHVNIDEGEINSIPVPSADTENEVSLTSDTELEVFEEPAEVLGEFQEESDVTIDGETVEAHALQDDDPLRILDLPLPDEFPLIESEDAVWENVSADAQSSEISGEPFKLDGESIDTPEEEAVSVELEREDDIFKPEYETAPELEVNAETRELEIPYLEDDLLTEQEIPLESEAASIPEIAEFHEELIEQTDQGEYLELPLLDAVDEGETDTTALSFDQEQGASREIKNDENFNDENFKNEIKTLLVYLDELLESLPEEKIREFAASEKFETYKKIFKELGLV